MQKNRVGPNWIVTDPTQTKFTLELDCKKNPLHFVADLVWLNPFWQKKSNEQQCAVFAKGFSIRANLKGCLALFAILAQLTCKKPKSTQIHFNFWNFEGLFIAQTTLSETQRRRPGKDCSHWTLESHPILQHKRNKKKRELRYVYKLWFGSNICL